MKRIITLALMVMCLSVVAMAQKVTISAKNQPAAVVFRSIVEQTGKNFVYSSSLLKDMRVSVEVRKKPLKHALAIMFDGSDIEWAIKGNSIILKRKSTSGRKMPESRVPASTD
ncbi:MAG: hypothetical protein K2F71_03975, partial [Paramuribaculum sp.]|nr:hypothetical protein [Paramuribaculum sp.]